jgi:hypothetical protein
MIFKSSIKPTMNGLGGGVSDEIHGAVTTVMVPLASLLSNFALIVTGPPAARPLTGKKAEDTPAGILIELGVSAMVLSEEERITVSSILGAGEIVNVISSLCPTQIVRVKGVSEIVGTRIALVTIMALAIPPPSVAGSVAVMVTVAKACSCVATSKDAEIAPAGIEIVGGAVTIAGIDDVKVTVVEVLWGELMLIVSRPFVPAPIVWEEGVSEIVGV